MSDATFARGTFCVLSNIEIQCLAAFVVVSTSPDRLSRLSGRVGLIGD